MPRALEIFSTELSNLLLILGNHAKLKKLSYNHYFSEVNLVVNNISRGISVENNFLMEV